MYNFKFGGLWISELGVMSSETPPIEIAQRDFELVKTPGKDGSDYVDNGRYENVEISRSVAMLTRSPFSAKERAANFIDAYAYLQGYQDFEDTDHNDLVTRAVLLNFKEVSRKLRTMHTATLKFSREPYWYLKGSLIPAGLDLSADVPTAEYHNPFRAESEPLIIFNLVSSAASVASFTFAVTTAETTAVYNYDIVRSGISGAIKVIVDCESKRATLVSQNASTEIDLSLPSRFGTGVTTFSITAGKSNLSRVEIAPRWRCL